MATTRDDFMEIFFIAADGGENFEERKSRNRAKIRSGPSATLPLDLRLQA